MNRNEQAEDHQRKSNEYLRNTLKRYRLSSTSGFYEPKSYQAADPQKIESEQQKENKRPQATKADWWSVGIGMFGVFISVATLVALILTVLASLRQWDEAHRTADASVASSEAASAAVLQGEDALAQSKNQFTLDQRPYLWVDLEAPTRSRLETVYPDKTVTDVACDIRIRNFGKSPAVKVQSLSYISAEPGGGEDDIRWSKMPFSGAGIYPPQSSFTTTARTQKPVKLSDVVMRPIADVILPNIYSIHILVEYSDQIGNRYRSEFCMVFQANGYPITCKHHNEIR